MVNKRKVENVKADLKKIQNRNYRHIILKYRHCEIIISIIDGPVPC